jgi:hypothetical protein
VQPQTIAGEEIVPFESQQAKELRSRRDERIWQLHIQGTASQAICDILEREGFGVINRNTVHYAINRKGGKKSEKLSELAVVERTRQVYQLRHIVEESLRAWEQSKDGRKLTRKTTASKGKDGEAESSSSLVEENEDAGPDPRYLRQAVDAMKAIRPLLGIEEVGESGNEPAAAENYYVIHVKNDTPPPPRAIEPASVTNELPALEFGPTATYLEPPGVGEVIEIDGSVVEPVRDPDDE